MRTAIGQCLAIAEVVEKWLDHAMEHSDTMVIACNTLSIRHHQLTDSTPPPSGLKTVVSMADSYLGSDFTMK